MNRSRIRQNKRSSRINRRAVVLSARVARLVWRTAFFPIRLFLAVRRALTPASVTLLLIGIVSTNIIWGYPWIGIFAACVTMFVVGISLNRWSLPNLESDFVLPRSAVAGTPFQSKLILFNSSWFPALDLDVATQAKRRVTGTHSAPFAAHIDGRTIRTIPPGERCTLNTTLLCERRGIQRLPEIAVTTWFPFHLFKYTRRVSTSAIIPITPRLLTNEDHQATSGMLDSLGHWTRKVLSGDAMDYTGSREYIPGMPVRRWDFLSWARLGQPIIREYQSPSIRTITVIVDTATDPRHAADSQQAKQLLETVLSYAATAVEYICRQPIQIRLFVTGHEDSIQAESRTDRESLLIQLAAANPESADRASQAIMGICNQNDRTPVLLFSSRSSPLGESLVPPSVTLFSPSLDCESSNPGGHGVAGFNLLRAVEFS